MYFANASFIKDMLLTYSNDLAEINSTEYIVLEMTPVISIDSTAVHCLQDTVHHFRSQGIQVAFAMVGTRVEKTMGRAGLTKFVGREWFFQTVDEAVQYCVQHQHAKSAVASQQLEDIKVAAGDRNEAGITDEANPQSGIQISNSRDQKWTMVSISRLLCATNNRSIAGDVVSAFDDLNMSVTKTRIDVSGNTLEKHLYCVQDASTKGPLTDASIDRLHEVLSVLLSQHRQTPKMAPQQNPLAEEFCLSPLLTEETTDSSLQGEERQTSGSSSQESEREEKQMVLHL